MFSKNFRVALLQAVKAAEKAVDAAWFEVEATQGLPYAVEWFEAQNQRLRTLYRAASYLDYSHF